MCLDYRGNIFNTFHLSYGKRAGKGINSVKFHKSDFIILKQIYLTNMALSLTYGFYADCIVYVLLKHMPIPLLFQPYILGPVNYLKV